MSKVTDKAAFGCIPAISANAACGQCKRKKHCEEYGDFLYWKKINARK